MIPFRTAVVAALLAAAGLLTAGTASADPRLPVGPPKGTLPATDTPAACQGQTVASIAFDPPGEVKGFADREGLTPGELIAVFGAGCDLRHQSADAAP